MNKTDLVEAARLRTVPEFGPGDVVKVHVRVSEGGRERVQVFEGVATRRRGGGLRETFTVRKVSFGVGVERTFPLHSPVIARIEVVRRGDVRRAKLYYLRERRGKKARIKERRLSPEAAAALAAQEEQMAQEAREAAVVPVAEAPEQAPVKMPTHEPALEEGTAAEETAVEETPAQGASSGEEPASSEVGKQDPAKAKA